MATTTPQFSPLTDTAFGVLADFRECAPATAISCFVAAADLISDKLAEAGGLMVAKGLDDISNAPGQLVKVSEVFGDEVENYRETLTGERFFHGEIPEILVLSNMPPCRFAPPPRPEPATTAAGTLPVQFPHRRNWHTDQSYRRPPPDITLLYGAITPPPDQGQTMFADCTAAYAALDPDTQSRLRGLNGIHAPSWVGRTPDDVRAGIEPKPLLPHQQPQLQPLVRYHPDTGRPALYICEEKQMDFVDGPIAGLEPGPDGEGAALLRDLLQHTTRREFVYVHEWSPGDLVIGDNRCQLHAATWYDADTYSRLMWRTTVMGNPGAEYHGEPKSWISTQGIAANHGMEDA